MIKKVFFTWHLICFAVAVFAQTNRPNIIFILTDDQGYGDLACNGNPYIKTPNIDLLHSKSVSFTNYHVVTTCAPTRAGLMSGQNNNKIGAWHTVKGREILKNGVPTLADVLKNNGYANAIFGKWHLGDNYPFRPQDRGFDEVLIHKAGGIGQAPDYWNNDYFDDTYFHNGVPEKFNGYCTDVWFDNAIKFIDANKQKPFFCYLAINAPHSPYNVPASYEAMYKGNKNIAHPDFYGMITNIDDNIGKLNKKLEEMGIANNTIIIYMSDNGSSGAATFNKDGSVKAGYNAGMRGLKGSPYEGGHRVPFFIHWKNGGIDTQVDVNNITSYLDFMPTILDLCKINYTSSNLEGKSLSPLIYKQAANWPKRVLTVDTQREEFLVKNKDACVMTDDWRMVMQKGKTELYDIVNDPGETNNVAEQHPEIIKKLSGDYEQWWMNASTNKDAYNNYIIGNSKQKIVTINTHDAHSENSNPAWSQDMVRKGVIENGFYFIDVAKTGKYIFELRRWPQESGLKINEAAPAGDAIPGGDAYLPGKIMNYKTAELMLDDAKMSKIVGANDEAVSFKIKLKKGTHKLVATFTDDKAVKNNAYYLTIKRK